MPDKRFDGIIDVDSACAQADSPGQCGGILKAGNGLEYRLAGPFSLD
jgi:hypothetical protein